MTTKIKAILFPVAVLVSLAAYSVQPFDRYQTVIDRKPFGPEPVNFDPEAAPGSAAAAAAAESGAMTEEQRTAEEQQLAASVRVSMINVTPSGAVAVGFTDTSANPAENYYLIVGRSQNGWTVKNADPSTETVELEKGGVEIKVKLGETVGGGNAKAAKGRRPARPMTLQSRGGPPAHDPQFAGAAPAAAPGGVRLGGLARLRQRRAEMRAKAQEEEAKKAEADAVAAAEREERAEREAEERRQRAERDAEERAQQREALRQIQEQLRKEREAREAAEQQTEQAQEE